MLVAQLCLTLCDPTDWSPPGSCVHEIFQARILGCVAISFSRGSSQPRDWTWVSCTAGRFFTDWATRQAPIHMLLNYKWIIKEINQINYTSIKKIFFKLKKEGGRRRWQRSPALHKYIKKKLIKIWNNSYRAISRWPQKTPGLQKGKLISLEWGRTKETH